MGMNTWFAHCWDSSYSIDYLWPENVSVCFFFCNDDGNLLNHDGSAIDIF